MPLKKPDDLWTVLRMLEWATEFFKKKNIPDPRHSIEWILAEVLDCKRLDLYLKYERPLSPGELNDIRPLIQRRAAHEPLQYIIGYTEFMGCRIDVNPSVLIPRIETEQFVELILDLTSDQYDKKLNILDIGTGSGCIPVAIKKKVPEWNLFGVDISTEALKTAESNAKLNNAEVTFMKGDLFNLGEISVPAGGWDVIVSNPPYIATSEKPGIQKQVIEYEPESALFHDRPLEVYRHISNYSSEQHASLFLELNDRLSEEILNLVQHVYDRANMHIDLDRNPRFISALI